MPPVAKTSADRLHAPSRASTLARFSCEVVDPLDPAWDRLAAAFADMCIEQTFAFASARWNRLHPMGVILREAGKAEPAAMALAVVATLPVLGLGIAYVKFGPLWRRRGAPADPETLRAALAALKQEFAFKRHLLVRILPSADPDYQEVWREALASSGFLLHAGLPDRERYLVNLQLSEQEQMASLGSQWRANLKKASSKLVIDELDLETGVPLFLTLYRDMLRRKQFDDHHGIEDLPAIAAAAGPLGMRLFIASFDGEPVVGSIVVGSGERVFVPFSATADRALPLRAGYALRWAIINRLRDTGARWLDLGGVEGNAGLRHYKIGNVGKRGRVVEIPGEFDFVPNPLAAAAAKVIMLGRDLVRKPALHWLVLLLPF